MAEHPLKTIRPSRPFNCSWPSIGKSTLIARLCLVSVIEFGPFIVDYRVRFPEFCREVVRKKGARRVRTSLKRPHRIRNHWPYPKVIHMLKQFVGRSLGALYHVGQKLLNEYLMYCKAFTC